MQKIVLLVLISLALFNTACRKKKKLKAENNLASAPATSVGGGTGEWVKLPIFSPNYFTTKTKIKFEDSTMSVQVGASFRGEKGALIWGSVTYALGIEVARLLIRTDSAFVWDKFNGQLIVADYKSFAENYGAPASLEVLQEMLISGKVSWLAEMEKLKETSGDTSKLAANSAGATHRSWLLGQRLYSQTVNMLPSGPLLQITNADFKAHEGVDLPHRKTIDFYQQGRFHKPAIKLVVEHSKFDFPKEKPDMPFDYPKGIKRMEIE